MSSDYTMMIRPTNDATAEDLQGDLATIVGQQFVADSHGDGFVASAEAGVVELFVEDASFEDDGELRFSQYDWYVAMQKPRDAARQKQVLDLLWRIYRGLVDTGRYGCLFVEDWVLIATNDEMPHSGGNG